MARISKVKLEGWKKLRWAMLLDFYRITKKKNMIK